MQMRWWIGGWASVILGLLGGTAVGQTVSAWPTPTPTVSWGQGPFEPTLDWVAPGLARFSMTIAPGQALDEEALRLQASSGWQIRPVSWPSTEAGPAGQPVWRHSFAAWIQIQPTQALPPPLTLTVRFQGCANDGVCHPPEQRQLHPGETPEQQATLVVLSAPWCGPCQAQDQRVDEMAQQGRLQGWRVVHVEAPAGDTAGAFLKEFGVPGLPALRWFAPGEVVSRSGGHTLLGERSKAAIGAALKAPSSS